MVEVETANFFNSMWLGKKEEQVTRSLRIPRTPEYYREGKGKSRGLQ